MRRALLEYIQEFHNTNGYAPTVRELMARFGVASPSTTHKHLFKLREQGYVDWVEGQPRTLHLTDDGHTALVVL